MNGCRPSSATISTSTGIQDPAEKGCENPIHVAALIWMGIKKGSSIWESSITWRWL
jgi:hypothetical protein